MGIFITYLLCFYISVLTSCPHMNVPCCANMTNVLFTDKMKVNVKVTKNQNLAQNQMLAHFKILAHFKGICAEFVFTML